MVKNSFCFLPFQFQSPDKFLKPPPQFTLCKSAQPEDHSVSKFCMHTTLENSLPGQFWTPNSFWEPSLLVLVCKSTSPPKPTAQECSFSKFHTTPPMTGTLHEDLLLPAVPGIQGLSLRDLLLTPGLVMMAWLLCLDSQWLQLGQAAEAVLAPVYSHATCGVLVVTIHCLST